MIRQALRRNPWAFLGPAATQALAAALVTTGLVMIASFDGAAMRESDIADLGVVFLMSSIYLSLLIVGVTMGTAIADQAQDIALLRTIGATPARVRRAIALQAVIVALPATAFGIPAGLLLGSVWLHGLTTHGIVPAEVTYRMHPGTVPIALAVTVGTSLIGASIAAIRPSRLRPAIALAEAAVPRRRGFVRTGVGVVLVAGGVVLAVLISGLDAAAADSAGFFVMLAMCIGVGLLGPVLLHLTAPIARWFGPVGQLAADITLTRARALSGALVPLTLAVGFAAFTVVLGQTTDHVTGVAAPAGDRWLEFAGTGAYTAFAAIAAVNTLVTVVLARRRDLAVMRLTGGTRGHTLAVVVCEALVVTATALLAGAAVALTTLLPLLHTALGTWMPWLPVTWLLGGIAITAALVLAGMVLPALSTVRRAPIEVVG